MAEAAHVDIIGPDPEDGIELGKPEGGTPEPQPESKRPSGGIETVSPFDIPNAGTDRAPGDTPKRARGRPPGSKNRTTAAGTGAPKVPKNLELTLEEFLLAAHSMAAVFLSSPELELDEDEASEGAKHIKNISDLLGHRFDPKTLIYGGAAMWFIKVYGTRGVAIYKRVTSEAEKQPKTPQPARATEKTATESKTSDVAYVPSQLWNEPPQGD